MSQLLFKQMVVASLIPFFLLVVVPTLRQKGRSFTQSEQERSPMPTEIFGVKIEKNPPESRLKELGVRTWSTWEGSPSKFPWTFTATETMYLLEGKVKVYIDGYDESFEIAGGDLVVFPKGMKVTWDITEAVKKHYSLEK